MILANSQINPDDLTTGSIAELIDQGYVGASECTRLKRKGGPMILSSRLFPNFEIGILEVLPSPSEMGNSPNNRRVCLLIPIDFNEISDFK